MMNAPAIHYDPIGRSVERQQTVYRHLETDEEFQARIRAAGHDVLMAFPDVKRPGESSDQFYARVRRPGESEYACTLRMKKKEVFTVIGLFGEKLDEIVGLKLHQRLMALGRIPLDRGLQLPCALLLAAAAPDLCQQRSTLVTRRIPHQRSLQSADRVGAAPA